MADFEEEFKNFYETISEHGGSFVNDNETILVFGKSKTVLELLTGAQNSGKKFTCLIVNSLQRKEGEEMLAEYQKRNIPAYVVSESSLFSILLYINNCIKE